MGGFAAGMNKTVQPGFAWGKQANRPSGVGNAFPLWWLAPPPFPLFEGALWMLSSVLHDTTGKRRAIYSPPLNRAGVPRSGIGGGERSEPISRTFIMPYDTGRQSRNAGSFLRKELGEALRNTEFPPTGIYQQLRHYRLLPRSFAVAQDDSWRREGKHVTLTLYSSPAGRYHTL